MTITAEKAEDAETFKVVSVSSVPPWWRGFIASQLLSVLSSELANQSPIPICRSVN